MPYASKSSRVRDQKVDKICEKKIEEGLNYIKKTSNKIIITSLFWDGYFTKLYKKRKY